MGQPVDLGGFAASTTAIPVPSQRDRALDAGQQDFGLGDSHPGFFRDAIHAEWALHDQDRHERAPLWHGRFLLAARDDSTSP